MAATNWILVARYLRVDGEVAPRNLRQSRVKVGKHFLKGYAIIRYGS